MHDAGGGVAQQRLHPHPGPEVLEAILGVGLGGAAVVGLAPLPVPDPVGGQLAHHHGGDGHRHVEQNLDGGGDVAEDLPADGGFVVPPDDGGGDAGGAEDDPGAHAGGQHDLVGLDPRHGDQV